MHFTITPHWFLRLLKKVKQVSDWIDEHLFPVEDSGTGRPLSRQELQLMAEQDANKIRQRIEACRTLSEATYGIRPMFDKYRVMYGNTPQVQATEGSLRLALFHKENEIVEALTKL